MDVDVDVDDEVDLEVVFDSNEASALVARFVLALV